MIAAVRRRGIGSALLEEAERLVAARSTFAGIGLGLYTAYRPAQRLYVKRGYVPDGAGAVYENEPLEPGRFVKVDDDLVLHLIKRLLA